MNRSEDCGPKVAAHLTTLILVAMATWSCMTPGPVQIDYLEDPLDHHLELRSAQEYERILARLTRSVEVYQNFEAKIFVNATYFSRVWRQAYIAQRARIHRLPPSEMDNLAAEHRQAAGQAHEFFVAVYTGDHRWNDLDKESSMWRVSLVNSREEEVLPLSIKRVDTRYSDVASFFPYLTVFKVAYAIRFPLRVLETNNTIIDTSCDSFRLLLSSAVGIAELTWEVALPQQPSASSSAHRPHHDSNPGSTHAPSRNVDDGGYPSQETDTALDGTP